MEKEQMNYFGATHPYVMVKKLTKEIIEETIHVYVKKKRWILAKIYHFAGNSGTSVFNQLQAKEIEYQKIKRIK